MSKKVVAAFRCLEKNGEWTIEKWKEASDVGNIVCAATIIEYLANRYEVTPEEMAQSLLNNINSSPMELIEKYEVGSE